MTDSKLPLWPFLAADVLLICAASLIYSRAHRPWMWWEAVLIVFCGVCAAGSLIFPFVRRAQSENAATQAALLSQTAAELRKAEQFAAEITSAARQWSQLQEQSARSAAAAAALAESITSGTTALADSLRKSGDAERNRLRLEADKLRRAESDWLQVVVHILDHIYALFQAARHSAQPGLAEQIGNFQNSCREIARRVGLAPAIAAPGDKFDTTLHQLPNGETAGENATVAETLATGYTYQGQIVRRALVSLQ